MFTGITSHSSESSTVLLLFICLLFYSVFILVLVWGCLFLFPMSFWLFILSIFSVSHSSSSFAQNIFYLLVSIILIHLKCFSWFISLIKSFLISIQTKHIIPHVYENMICFPQHTSHTSSFREIQRDAYVSLMIIRQCSSQYWVPDICVSPCFWVFSQLSLLILWDQEVPPDKF